MSADGRPERWVIDTANETRAVSFGTIRGEASGDPIGQDPKVDRLIRYALARCAGESCDIEDLGDVADLFELSGLSDPAALLRSAIELHRGVSRLRQPNETMVTIVDDLARIPDLSAREGGGAIWWTGEIDGFDLINRDPDPKALDEQQIGAALSRLHRNLMHEASNTDLAALQEVLIALAPLAAAEAFDIADATCPLPRLAIRAACNCLRQFLRRHRLLAYPPFGSAELLHAAARLRHGALGPYFLNVERLLAGGSDILGIIGLTIGPDGEADDAERFDRWLVALANNLPDSRMCDLVDVLGNRGLLRPIRAILAAQLARDGRCVDQVLLWRMRDAALDLGDPHFGADIQRFVTRLRPADATEFIALAEIEATIGDAPSVESALDMALTLDPEDIGIRDRLRALRNGRFAIYHAQTGFGSSRETIRIRRRFRQASPDAAAQIALGA